MVHTSPKPSPNATENQSADSKKQLEEAPQHVTEKNIDGPHQLQAIPKRHGKPERWQFDCVKKHHQMCVPDVGSDVCKIRATQRPGSHQICPDWVTKPSAKHASAIRLC